MRPSISDPKIARFAEAYLMMAALAKYRPAAPSDGYRQHPADQRSDRRPRSTATGGDPVRRGLRQGRRRLLVFAIGCSGFTTNRAFVYVIEAARMLAGGDDGDATQQLRLG